MRRPALTRLRAGFVALALLLLLPLGFLLREAEARFEEQRRLRHEIVAERIFDEMERELTLLLKNEAARPSSAYDTQTTQVATWSPWVVGYFAFDGDSLRLTAREQLADARAERVKRAFAQLSEEGALRALLRPPVRQAAPERDQSPAAPPRQVETRKAKTKQQEEVLRQLNRASVERQKAKRKRKPRRAPNDLDDDPLMGLEWTQ